MKKATDLIEEELNQKFIGMKREFLSWNGEQYLIEVLKNKNVCKFINRIVKGRKKILLYEGESQ